MKYVKDNYEVLYQVDSSTYSGGSGCPFVDEEGFLVGILFQNLKFETKDSYMQVPNSGFIISKYVVLEIVDLIQNSKFDEIPSFEKIKMFNISNSILDPIFNFRGLKPKF